ncbi:MAG: hypothetical protein A2Z34_05890 [Planctomycetes bacterium RBG_16_59_8]|nr:MAG: hypothetical protein A2Z34_05890 [Planctomycetes bacterium RBG_16_59_8]
MADKTKILLVDDEAAFRGVMRSELERMGYEVEDADGGAAALDKLSRSPFHVVLLDIQMPEMDGLSTLERIVAEHPEVQVIMLTGQGTIESAVDALHKGAFHYLTKPCRLTELRSIVNRAAERMELVEDRRTLDRLVRSRLGATKLVGISESIRSLDTTIAAVAKSGSPVLIQGESGTGKELVATAIHLRGARARRPFIPINCAAFSEGILESELFGHEKGAFTGASSAKPGLFEAAHGGAIFLDEIAEMNPSVQAKLLRVIESGETRRVGSVKSGRVDVRVIAATNVDVESAIAEGTFRRDLYFRLNVVQIKLTPLRDRPEDIPVLFDHFLRRSGSGPSRRVDEKALRILQEYPWPGNVRELQNLAERLLILSSSDVIDPEELSRLAPSLLLRTSAPAASTGGQTIAALEREHILRVLAATGGDKESAAKSLGISLKTLYNKLKEYGEGPGH